jgi:hypothetical protein
MSFGEISYIEYVGSLESCKHDFITFANQLEDEDND